MDHPEFGHRNGHPPTLPQHIEHVERDREHKQRNREAEGDDRVLTLPDTLDGEPKTTDGVVDFDIEINDRII